MLTRERLLKAAAQVFARDGLAGATTREIARLADVNEVTLFRHFQNKKGLISAVVNQTFDAVSGRAQSGNVEAQGIAETGPASEDVCGVLRRFVRVYHALLSEHLPLIRTLVGEIHRHEEQEARVLHGVFRPRRQELIENLKAARDRGLVRVDVDFTIVADQLSGMIFGHVIRRASPLSVEYGAKKYLEACVELVARGIEAPASVSKRHLKLRAKRGVENGVRKTAARKKKR